MEQLPLSDLIVFTPFPLTSRKELTVWRFHRELKMYTFLFYRYEERKIILDFLYWRDKQGEELRMWEFMRGNLTTHFLLLLDTTLRLVVTFNEVHKSHGHHKYRQRISWTKGLKWLKMGVLDRSWYRSQTPVHVLPNS